MDHLEDVLTHAWAEGTREAYRSGLLVFHIFCDEKLIPKTQRAPACEVLLASFISTIAGSYSGKTISNYLHGVRAWHLLHGAKWELDNRTTEVFLRAAENLTPPSSRRKKRQPFTVDIITNICSRIDDSKPLGAAVKSCLLTTFYSAARLGEFTVKRLNAFDPTLHVKVSDVTQTTDKNGLRMTVFHIPKTKSAPEGEDVSWAAQSGPTDPEAAHKNHLHINSPPPDHPLFSYRHKTGYRPLSKREFLKVIGKAAHDAGVEPLQGHGIRIGATLEYLLRGVPFDVMKSIGRWGSDAFLLYLRKHAQIMAPYMQATPLIHDSFVRYTMPPVR